MVNLYNNIYIYVSFFVIAVMYIDIHLVIFNNKQQFFFKYVCGISAHPNATDVVHSHGVPCRCHQCLCYW
jgi:hypothetical protein